jgi:hypothetical protein
MIKAAAQACKACTQLLSVHGHAIARRTPEDGAYKSCESVAHTYQTLHCTALLVVVYVKAR